MRPASHGFRRRGHEHSTSNVQRFRQPRPPFQFLRQNPLHVQSRFRGIPDVIVTSTSELRNTLEEHGKRLFTNSDARSRGRCAVLAQSRRAWCIARSVWMYALVNVQQLALFITGLDSDVRFTVLLWFFSIASTRRFFPTRACDSFFPYTKYLHHRRHGQWLVQRESGAELAA